MDLEFVAADLLTKAKGKVDLPEEEKNIKNGTWGIPFYS